MGENMMYAVIDIGSNTIRLVIYSMENGSPCPMLNKKYSAGLAGYVNENNEIGEEGVAVLFEVLADIEKILKYIRPNEVYPFGTAALRNSANGEKIVQMVKEKCGFTIQILSGKEEAVFDYCGALEGGLGDSGLLVDVGGGSTELTFFVDQEIKKATSIPLGSLNLYKKWVGDLLPSHDEARCIKKEIKGFLKEIDLDAEALIAQPIYSVGGTARAALKLMRERHRIGNTNTYTYEQLKEVLQYQEESKRELLKSILRTSPDRVHTIIPGLLVFQTIAKFFGSKSFVTIGYGVREGYLMHKLEQEGNPHEQPV